MTMELGGAQIASVFLVLMRCVGFVLAAPLLGHRAVPLPLKAGISIVLAIALTRTATDALAGGAAPSLLAAPLEVMIGLAFGFMMSLAFYGVEIAGRLLSLQSGLSLESILSPTHGESSTALDPFFSVLAGLLFLALNLHVALVQVLATSFTTFPMGGAWPNDLWLLVARVTSLLLEIATRVALPLALVLLLAELAVALVARAIPQINVFILSLPLKLMVAVVTLIVGLPALVSGSSGLYRFLFSSVARGVTP